MMRGGAWSRQGPLSACIFYQRAVSCVREHAYGRGYSNTSSPSRELRREAPDPSDAEPREIRLDKAPPPRRPERTWSYVWRRSSAGSPSPSLSTTRNSGRDVADKILPQPRRSYLWGRPSPDRLSPSPSRIQNSSSDSFDNTLQLNGSTSDSQGRSPPSDGARADPRTQRTKTFRRHYARDVEPLARSKFSSGYGFTSPTETASKSWPRRAADGSHSQDNWRDGQSSREQGWDQLARRRGPSGPDAAGSFVSLTRTRPGPVAQSVDGVVKPQGDAALTSSQISEGDFWARVRDSVADPRAEQKRPPQGHSDNWAWAKGLERERARPAVVSEPSRDWVSTYASTNVNTRQRHEKPKRKPRIRRRESGGEGDEDDSIDYDYLEKRRRQKAEKKARKARGTDEALEKPSLTPILLPEFISVSNLAAALGVKPGPFLGQLEELGFQNISPDSIMTGETAALVAQEYGFEPAVDTGEDVDLKPRPLPEDVSTLSPRPPVVTIMGHVDHGKTTLLDWLRKSSVAAQEHGGITQHIGAFSVTLSSGKRITFLDTPGHAAFLTMRQRGANVTDIVILVVAADDSVKPQTLEALKHARAAKVPIIVAINKIDKDGVRIDQVKADLARHGVEIEDYGGDVQVVCVSGKTGQGMGDLEENILTLSEILDLRAETDGMAEGWVLEATTKPIGRVATVLVKRGTLRAGDFIVAGAAWTKIRVLRNEAGLEVREAPPGSAIEILGWKDAPRAGDQVLQAPNGDRARAAAEYREGLKEREKDVAEMEVKESREREKTRATGEDESGDDIKSSAGEEAGTKVINFTIKGDVIGSVEAVCAVIMEMGNNEVRPRILQSAAGQISESDVELAATSGSCIINFNNPVLGHVRALADTSRVNIIDHTVIYHLVDDVKGILSKHLAPTISTRVVGEAEVLQVFPINVKGRVYRNVAGCRVRNGHLSRGSKYRLVRKGEKLFEGDADSLKQGKKDVAEARKGTECGISFTGWEDFREGDLIQAYTEVSEKRNL